jgi:hypothetical protein
MTLDMLLYLLGLRRDLLVSADEVYWSSHGPDRRIVRALRRHRRGLALLLQWSSIGTCPARDLHRKFWRYAGQGRYVCEYCERTRIA